MPIIKKEIMESTFPLSKPKTLKLMLGGDSQEKKQMLTNQGKNWFEGLFKLGPCSHGKWRSGA
jgi:hypothetical protein